jgi:hypothetical protein
MNFMDDVKEWSESEATRQPGHLVEYHLNRIAARRAHNKLMIDAVRKFSRRILQIFRERIARLRFTDAAKDQRLLRPRRPGTLLLSPPASARGR